MGGQVKVRLEANYFTSPNVAPEIEYTVLNVKSQIVTKELAFGAPSSGRPHQTSITKLPSSDLTYLAFQLEFNSVLGSEAKLPGSVLFENYKLD